MFIIILATTIAKNADRLRIRREMDTLAGAGNWSVDLEDVDKVLRVVVSSNLLPEVIMLLKKHRFEYTVMGIFDTEVGMECPLPVGSGE